MAMKSIRVYINNFYIKILILYIFKLYCLNEYRRVKKLKTSSLIIGVIAIVIIAYLATSLNFGPGEELNVFSGRLAITFNSINRVDGAARSIAWSSFRCIHGSMDYNDQVATVSAAAVTGTVRKDDKGIWYVVIDYPNSTAPWLDYSETLKDPFVAEIFGADGDRDGFHEDYLKLNFNSLPTKTEYETTNINVKLVLAPARVASIDYTSLTNVTDVGTTSYSYKAATGYMTGFSEGDLAKLAKTEIVFDTTGTNETYPDAEYWKLTHLKLGPYTFTSAQFGAYDLANVRYQLKFGDQVNHQGGKNYYYEKNAGTLWATYELKAYCKWDANTRITITIKFYFYKPDGTLTSAFSQVIEFRTAYS